MRETCHLIDDKLIDAAVRKLLGFLGRRQARLGTEMKLVAKKIDGRDGRLLKQVMVSVVVLDQA